MNLNTLALCAVTLAGNAPFQFDSQGDDVARIPPERRIPADQWLELSGRAQIFGREARWRWMMAGDGRFARSIKGELDEQLVFDGQRVWQKDERGPSYELQWFSRELAMIETWAVLGFPEVEGEPIQWNEVELGRPIRFRKSALSGAVAFDQESGQLSSVEYSTSGSSGSVRYTDWRLAADLSLPHTIEVETSQGVRQKYFLEEARRVVDRSINPFVRPEPAAEDVRFDSQHSLEIPLVKAASGHLFLELELDGRNAGWFVFDTGAAVSVVTSDVASAFGMSAVGESIISGAGQERSKARLVRGKELRLGRLSIQDRVWLESDVLKRLGDLVGHPVMGILGWDVLARAVIELDLDKPCLRVHEPRTFDDSAYQWEELVLHRRHPFMKASFGEGYEGWFCFDSGAGTTSVLFHRPTVERLRLDQNQELQDLAAAGAGGALALKLGQLSRFHIAGRSHTEVPALFSYDAVGALCDEWSAGTVGQYFFHGLDLAFDYANARIGFRVREGE